MRSVLGRLHMHNHNEPNGRAFILGDKQALKALGDALMKASQCAAGFENIQLYTSDGHKYELLIARDISEEEWQSLPVPYDKKHDPNSLEIVKTYDELKSQVVKL